MKRAFRAFLRAFTLIEMLTVIAIIGILAGLLIPATRMAIAVARKNTAAADIMNLTQAATTYNLDFGAFPPDQWPLTLKGTVQVPRNPSECLIWYLTRSYSTNPSDAAAGRPWVSNGDWTPATTGTVFARVTASSNFDVKVKQRRDLRGQGFPCFLDPWGRPYMYRAYPQWHTTSISSGNILTITGTASGSSMPSGWMTNNNLANTVGQVELSDGSVTANNGTFAFSGTDTNKLMIPNFSSSGSPQLRFPLHNPQGCDIYSLGPNGLTGGAISPWDSTNNRPGEWKPVRSGGGTTDLTSIDSWIQVWGTGGDGNDIDPPNGNTVQTSDKDRDDISNWK